MVPNASKVITVAQSSINLREDPRGSNDGAALRAYLRDTPWEAGQPWCMDYVVATLKKALAADGGLPASVKETGSCQEAAEHAASMGKLVNDAATGCVFVLHNTEGHFHHAGIVIQVLDSGSAVRTIEGNTNANGSTEGFAVLMHQRPIGNLKFIIW